MTRFHFRRFKSLPGVWVCAGLWLAAAAGASWLRCTGYVEYSEKEDGVHDVDGAIVIGVAGVLAGRLFRALYEQGVQQVDSIDDIGGSIGVAVPSPELVPPEGPQEWRAQEQSGDQADASLHRCLGSTPQDSPARGFAPPE